MNSQIILSLGYNCEISFRIEDYFGRIDAYLFSWSFEEDRTLFLDALEHIDNIFNVNVNLRDDHMFADEVYKIKFHPRYEILPKVGSYSHKQYIEALDELTSRLNHLKDKTQQTFLSKNDIIFLIKIEDLGEESNYNYILALYNILSKVVVYKNFKLVCIFEKKAILKRINELTASLKGLRIRTVKRFAPVKHTDICGDIRGWYKILREFMPIEKTNYFKNIFLRRKKVILTIIKNKMKSIFN